MWGNERCWMPVCIIVWRAGTKALVVLGGKCNSWGIASSPEHQIRL